MLGAGYSSIASQPDALAPSNVWLHPDAFIPHPFSRKPQTLRQRLAIDLLLLLVVELAPFTH